MKPQSMWTASTTSYTAINETTIDKVPWHVGIYNNDTGVFQLNCSGTIIYENLVITSQDCFCNSNGALYDVRNASQFKIGAGKTFSHYLGTGGVADEESAQYLDVKDFYNVKSNMLIVLKTNITFNRYIAPICYEIDDEHDKGVAIGINGTMAGWGLQCEQPSSGWLFQRKEPHHTLKVAQVPAADKKGCNLVKRDSQRFYVGSTKMETTVCKEDRGAGWFYSKRVHNQTRYFIRGVVQMNTTTSEHCVTSNFHIFTNLNKK